MKSDWIIDVLADLRRYSRERGLTDLAEKLDDTMAVALRAARAPRTREGASQDGTSTECLDAGGLAGGRCRR